MRSKARVLAESSHARYSSSTDRSSSLLSYIYAQIMHKKSSNNYTLDESRSAKINNQVKKQNQEKPVVFRVWTCWM